MAKQNIDRKIAVIFATDVVSYSKHVEIDESNTLKNLRSCKKNDKPSQHLNLVGYSILISKCFEWRLI